MSARISIGAKVRWCVILIFVCSACAQAKGVHHYAFFNRDRQKITEAAFLGTKAFEGAQLKYTWRELEREKGAYDFSAIEHDLVFLQSKGDRKSTRLNSSHVSESRMPSS